MDFSFGHNKSRAIRAEYRVSLNRRQKNQLPLQEWDKPVGSIDGRLYQPVLNVTGKAFRGRSCSPFFLREKLFQVIVDNDGLSIIDQNLTFRSVMRGPFLMVNRGSHHYDT
jgi:hypothetical protein